MKKWQHSEVLWFNQDKQKAVAGPRQELRASNPQHIFFPVHGPACPPFSYPNPLPSVLSFKDFSTYLKRCLFCMKDVFVIFRISIFPQNVKFSSLATRAQRDFYLNTRLNKGIYRSNFVSLRPSGANPEHTLWVSFLREYSSALLFLCPMSSLIYACPALPVSHPPLQFILRIATWSFIYETSLDVLWILLVK